MSSRPSNIESMASIDGAIDAIDSMLNSLLDISKLDAGVVRPEIGPVDLGERWRGATTTTTPSPRRHRPLRLGPSRAPLRGDTTMLQRILANLVSNALRYTVNGRVLVGARKRGGSIGSRSTITGPASRPMRSRTSSSNSTSSGILSGTAQGLGARARDREAARRPPRTQDRGALDRRPRLAVFGHASALRLASAR